MKPYIYFVLVFLGIFLTNSHLLKNASAEADLVAEKTAQTTQTKCQVYFEDSDFNFQYEIPGRPWVVVDPRKVNPRAKLAIKHSQKKVTFMVLARENDQGLSLDVFADAVYEELKRIHKGATVYKESPNDLHGIPGVNYGVYIHEKEFFKVWACIHGGIAYQLVYDGEFQNISVIKQEFNQLISNFSLIMHPV